MAKTNARFKDAFNHCLDVIRHHQIGDNLPGENEIARMLHVSRTIVRSILLTLDEKAIISWQGRKKEIVRLPTKDDRFAEEEVSSASDKIETKFLEWILLGDIPPGTVINELELARQHKVSTTTVREFLINFSRFGLIEKSPTHKWVLKGFTRNYALELSDVRNMFEMKAVRLFTTLEKDHAVWSLLDQIEQDHLTLLEHVEEHFHDFSELDERFHKAINNVANNRFIDDFQDIISLIFHYHYQWNKKDEKERNIAAIKEHLVYIEALRSQDLSKIEIAAQRHLATARKTLLDSLKEVE